MGKDIRISIQDSGIDVTVSNTDNASLPKTEPEKPGEKITYRGEKHHDPSEAGLVRPEFHYPSCRDNY
jgi:hypothetical protein